MDLDKMSSFENEQDIPEETEGSEDPFRLYSSDTGTEPLEIREVLVTLLRGPYIWRDKQVKVWETLEPYEAKIRSLLSNLFLELVLVPEDGLAFIRQADTEGRKVPSLLRGYSYRFLDSVLLVECRERLLRTQHTGERASISREEIDQLLSVYVPTARSDQKKFQNGVDAILKRLKERHILISLDNSLVVENYEISPILRHVLDAETMKELADKYQEKLGRTIELEPEETKE